MYAKERKTIEGSLRNGAIPSAKEVTFSLKVPSDADTKQINLFIWKDGETAVLHEMKRIKSDFGEETWETTVPPFKEGLCFYNYETFSNEGRQIFGGESDPYLTENADRQLLIYDSDYTTPPPLHGAMIYHIFVDRFAKSGRAKAKRGTVIDEDWYGGTPQYGAYPGAEVANNVFFGGDLWGIIEKLPYIRSLGADYIYLSPVFDAATNHKYDTGDYLTVDEMFGGDEALSALCGEAKKYGIGVILDGVFNHTGSDSVYFNKESNYPTVGAYNSPLSPYYPWYSFRDYPDDYECWWGVKILPRVDSANVSYRHFIMDKVIPKWMKFGVSGWRLDVADELSDVFLDSLRSTVKSINPDGAIIGEVWEDATNKTAYGKRRRYLRGAQLDSVMNYPFRNAVISYIRDGDAGSFCDTVNGIVRRYPKTVLDSLMNFLGTHDTPRIITVLGGEAAEGHSNDELAAMKMTPAEYSHARKLTVMAFLLIGILPGALSVYYGDEIGMEGYHDPFCRRPFPWGREDETILFTVRRLGEIRHDIPLFRDGEVRIVSADADHIIVQRTNADKSDVVMCVINRSERPLSVESSVGSIDLFMHEQHNGMSVIPPQSGTYLRLSCVPEVRVTYY